jgi:hypothetical protein
MSDRDDYRRISRLAEQLAPLVLRLTDEANAASISGRPYCSTIEQAQAAIAEELYQIWFGPEEDEEEAEVTEERPC